MQDPIEDLAELVKRYYSALRQRNIPEQLAMRMTGDWHQAILAASVGEPAEKQVQTAQQITRRAGRVGRQ